jgi:hypothetical protein
MASTQTLVPQDDEAAPAFQFTPRLGKVNWRSLGQLDLAALRVRGDVSQLRYLLGNVIGASVSPDDLAAQSDELIAKLVLFMQSSLEYMVHVQREQALTITSLQHAESSSSAALRAVQADCDALKAELRSARQAAVSLEQQLQSQVAASAPSSPARHSRRPTHDRVGGARSSSRRHPAGADSLAHVRGARSSATPPSRNDASGSQLTVLHSSLANAPDVVSSSGGGVEAETPPQLLFRCHLCHKAFKTTEFLDAHCARRHAGAVRPRMLASIGGDLPMDQSADARPALGAPAATLAEVSTLRDTLAELTEERASLQKQIEDRGREIADLRAAVGLAQEKADAASSAAADVARAEVARAAEANAEAEAASVTAARVVDLQEDVISLKDAVTAAAAEAAQALAAATAAASAVRNVPPPPPPPPGIPTEIMRAQEQLAEAHTRDVRSLEARLAALGDELVRYQQQQAALARENEELRVSAAAAAAAAASTSLTHGLGAAALPPAVHAGALLDDDDDDAVHAAVQPAPLPPAATNPPSAPPPEEPKADVAPPPPPLPTLPPVSTRFQLSHQWQRVPQLGPGEVPGLWSTGAGYRTLADAAGAPNLDGAVAATSAAAVGAAWAAVLPAETQVSTSLPPRVRIPPTWLLSVQVPSEVAEALKTHGISDAPTLVALPVSRSTSVAEVRAEFARMLGGSGGRIGPEYVVLAPGGGGAPGSPSSLADADTVDSADIFMARPLLRVLPAAPQAPVTPPAPQAAQPLLPLPTDSVVAVQATQLSPPIPLGDSVADYVAAGSPPLSAELSALQPTREATDAARQALAQQRPPPPPLVLPDLHSLASLLPASDSSLEQRIAATRRKSKSIIDAAEAAIAALQSSPGLAPAAGQALPLPEPPASRPAQATVVAPLAGPVQAGVEAFDAASLRDRAATAPTSSPALPSSSAITARTSSVLPASNLGAGRAASTPPTIPSSRAERVAGLRTAIGASIMTVLGTLARRGPRSLSPGQGRDSYASFSGSDGLAARQAPSAALAGASQLGWQQHSDAAAAAQGSFIPRQYLDISAHRSRAEAELLPPSPARSASLGDPSNPHPPSAQQPLSDTSPGYAAAGAPIYSSAAAGAAAGLADEYEAEAAAAAALGDSREGSYRRLPGSGDDGMRVDESALSSFSSFPMAPMAATVPFGVSPAEYAADVLAATGASADGVAPPVTRRETLTLPEGSSSIDPHAASRHSAAAAPTPDFGTTGNTALSGLSDSLARPDDTLSPSLLLSSPDNTTASLRGSAAYGAGTVDGGGLGRSTAQYPDDRILRGSTRLDATDTHHPFDDDDFADDEGGGVDDWGAGRDAFQQQHASDVDGVPALQPHHPRRFQEPTDEAGALTGGAAVVGYLGAPRTGAYSPSSFDDDEQQGVAESREVDPAGALPFKRDGGSVDAASPHHPPPALPVPAHRIDDDEDDDDLAQLLSTAGFPGGVIGSGRTAQSSEQQQQQQPVATTQHHAAAALSLPEYGEEEAVFTAPSGLGDEAWDPTGHGRADAANTRTLARPQTARGGRGSAAVARPFIAQPPPPVSAEFALQDVDEF